MNNIGVPPLSIESLVENSVKHVIALRPGGGGIVVTGTSSLDGAVIEVRDDGPGFALEAMPPRHGLENLSHRLELLFGSGGRLEQARTGRHSTVRVRLPVSTL